MPLTPDEIIYWQQGFWTLNATLLFSWVTMALLIGGARLVTRNLSVGASATPRQSFLESLVTMIQAQIREITGQDPARFLPFLGTLFLYHRHLEPAEHRARLPVADRFAVDYSCAGGLRLSRRPALRDQAAGRGATICGSTCSHRSSCCPSTSSANSRARWRWPCACSATS